MSVHQNLKISLDMHIFFLNIIFLLTWQISIGQQTNTSNCSNDYFKKNKNKVLSNSDREIIIPKHWIQVYQDTRFMTLLSSNMGKDLAYIKSKNLKLSFKKYEKQIDSLLVTIRNIKVITETEDLVESEYCYLLHVKQHVANMDYLIANNEISIGADKVLGNVDKNGW